MGLFNHPPRGFEAGNRPIVAEMKKWAAAGLIPEFNDYSLSSDVIASILKAVREHLTDAKTEA
jgi:hypothetical protein